MPAHHGEQDENTNSEDPAFATIHQYFPHKSSNAVKQAMEDCKRQLSEPHDLERMLECLRRKLG